jgi:hypothetical protein
MVYHGQICHTKCKQYEPLASCLGGTDAQRTCEFWECPPMNDSPQCDASDCYSPLPVVGTYDCYIYVAHLLILKHSSAQLRGSAGLHWQPCIG